MIVVFFIFWGLVLKKDYLEVENFMRFILCISFDNFWEVIVGDCFFLEVRILYIDLVMLDMFNWLIMNGDVSIVLLDLNMIVIIEVMVEKYFRRGDLIGKVLIIDLKEWDWEGNFNGNIYDFIILVVMVNVFEWLYFCFDFLFLFSILNDVYGGDINGEVDINFWYWWGLIGYIYLELKLGIDVDVFVVKFEVF